MRYYTKREKFLNIFSITFSMGCEKWKIRFLMKKARSYEEFMDYALDSFSDKLLMLILEKLELLQEDPFRYAREKLGNDI
jgi:hypothetical protein